MLLNIFVETCIFQDSLIYKKIKKEQHFFFKTEIFCNIINVFTVPLDQFNASLLNKNINMFICYKKNINIVYINKTYNDNININNTFIQ